MTYGVGGVYAEADVKCLRPLDEILPSNRPGLVLGWDSDAVWGGSSEYLQMGKVTVVDGQTEKHDNMHAHLTA